MPTEATSFVLRFRDLVTGTNETIALHEAIAKSEGEVWWGWWKKAGERSAIHAFKGIMGTGPIPILLLDSGQGCLHRAKCKQVIADLDPRPSPDKLKTPDYYRSQTYFTWFQLAEFAQIPASDARAMVNGLTYVQVDEFFADDRSPFRSFYGKRIYSIEEMIQQNRTVWFTRPAKVDDPSHEIELLNAEHTRPHHFAPSYFSSPSRTLLWTSDLHFSKDPTQHAFPDQAGAQDVNLWLALENALKDLKVERLAGAVVSGDFTWRADSIEFQKARTLFFDRLISSYALDPRQIAIVPGNHDIAFSDSPADKGTAVTHAALESEAGFRAFYEGLFRIAPNEFLSSGRRILIGGALPIDIVCLNSSLLQQHPAFSTDAKSSSPVFQGHGFLGTAQLQTAAEQFRWDTEPFSTLRPLRLAVLHHHVLPVAEAEAGIVGSNYSVVLDAERLSRWLVRHRIDIVLHGHQHQPFSAAITRAEVLDHDNDKTHTFRVLGMGSTGVAARHQGAIAKNTFGLLEFGADQIEVSYHSLHPSQASQKLFTLRVPYGIERKPT